MSSEFREVFFHRMRYFLTPQFDMYKNIRMRILAEEIAPGFPRSDSIDEPCSLLDYGCGNGVGSVMLKCNGWRVTGIDSDEEAVAFARDSWGHLAEFKHEDWAVKLGEEGKDYDRRYRDYDVVVCLEVIEHVADPTSLLQSLRDSCADDARVFISTLNHNSQYRKNRGHVGKFHVEDFRIMCQKAFPGARLYSYDLSEELNDESTLTPMVAYWKEGSFD